MSKRIDSRFRGNDGASGWVPMLTSLTHGVLITKGVITAYAGVQWCCPPLLACHSRESGNPILSEAGYMISSYKSSQFGLNDNGGHPLYHEHFTKQMRVRPGAALYAGQWYGQAVVLR